MEKTWPTKIRRQSLEIGIPYHSINTGKRKNLLVLTNESETHAKIVDIFRNNHKDLCVINKFENYEQIIETLNQYKVCINLNSMLDSIFGLSAGCSVIAKDSYYKGITGYSSISSIIPLIANQLQTFDIGQNKKIAKNLLSEYPHNTFTKQFTNSIVSNLMETFFI